MVSFTDVYSVFIIDEKLMRVARNDAAAAAADDDADDDDFLVQK